MSFQPIRLPDAIQAIVEALYLRHKDLAHGSEEQRRELTGKIAEQTRFTMGSEYGWKSSSGVPSKDSIAKRVGPVIHAWDLFNGGTREPNDHPMSVDISNQTFIEVQPINHLGSKPADPKEDPTDPLPSSGPGASIDREIRSLWSRLAAAEKRVAELEARPVGGAPTSIDGVKVAIETVNGAFVCAEGGGDADLNARRRSVGSWETFILRVQP